MEYYRLGNSGALIMREAVAVNPRREWEAPPQETAGPGYNRHGMSSILRKAETAYAQASSTSARLYWRREVERLKAGTQ